jgi:diguanylate cyclase (GGDEF)-like protein/PAS domain S-box-containing protein
MQDRENGTEGQAIEPDGMLRWPGAARLPPIFRRHPDAMELVTYPEGRIVDVNDAFAEIAGRSPAELIGRTTLEVGLWPSPDERERALAELVQRGRVDGRETEFIAADGTVRVGLASIELLEIDGEPHSLWVLHDITDQRRAEEQLRSRTAELETLLGIATVLSSTTELDVTLDTIARLAAETLGSPEAEIVVYDAETDELRTAAIYQSRWTAWAEALDQPVTGPEADLDRQLMAAPRVIIQMRSDPQLDAVTREIMERWDDHVYLCVPLRFGDRPLGLLISIETEQDRIFTEQELDLATAVGEQAALAIHTARQFDREREQNRRLTALVDASRTLASEIDIDNVNAELTRVAVEALDADWCSVFEYHAEDGKVTEKAICEHRGPGQPEMVGRTYRLSRRTPLADDEYPLDVPRLEAGEIVVERLGDPDLDPATRADMEEQNERSCLTVPLMSGGRAVGFFVIVHEHKEHVFGTPEIAVARAIAEQAAVGWERARLYRRLELLAITDGLTGVFNHRHFYERLAAEIKRADRSGDPLPLLMIDIDGFKLFNDRFGHQAGDDALRTIAEAILAEVRDGIDLVARYGGEEFTVLLPGAHDAVAAAERIRERVRGVSMATPVGEARLTVSIGVAVYPTSAADMDDLVARADAAMYIAKRLGKDRVEVAAPR